MRRDAQLLIGRLREHPSLARLPDDLVEFVDALVRDGDAKSRATVVTRALQRERRRAIAARDAEILARSGSDADMDAPALHVLRAPLDTE